VNPPLPQAFTTQPQIKSIHFVAESTQSLSIPDVPKSEEVQILPLEPKIFIKDKIGEDVQSKIRYLQESCYKIGMNQEQVRWTLALADHESAGTWSPTVKGDRGCSTGIGQWNACAGSNRKPRSLIFEDQADQLCEEMKAKFDLFDIETAIGKHNAPAWDKWKSSKYINKVRSALKLFN
jgi:hypothetical protein